MIVKLTKPKKKEKKEKEREKNGEPKKSTGEMVDNQSANKTNKHLKYRKKKLPGSGTIEFQP
jgi:hypothetical protein